jgi:fatty-acid desaturase
MESNRAGKVRYAPRKSLWFTGMAVSAAAGCASTFSWACLVLFMGSTAFVLLFGSTIGIHRKLIHDSFQCPRWLEHALVYVGVVAGMGGPLGSLYQHELRDQAQRSPDCHDYLCHGRAIWRDAWWQLHCAFEPADALRPHPRDSIAGNRFYVFLERTWELQQVPWAILLYCLGGWPFVAWGIAARVTVTTTGYWLMSYLAHNHGAVRFHVEGAAVQGRNLRFASLLTMGECWHNNHHACPGSARLGWYPGEWDPGWWVVAGLRRCRLAWDIRLPGPLPARHDPGAGRMRAPGPVGRLSR